MEISQKELKKVLKYDSITGIFTWKTSGSGRKSITAGSLNPTSGYVVIRVNRILYYAHRLAWLYVYGYFPENDLDHKDRIKHHNWIKNLREVSDVCNTRNTGNRKNNTSGVKGTIWSSQRSKWTARIRINYKLKYLGSYDDFDDAVCARLAGEQCVNWEGCDSSSPAYKYVVENIQQN